MITREEISRLASLHSDNGIVSVYIKIDPRLNYERAQPAMKFKSAYSRARRSASEATVATLEREHGRILAFLEGWEPHGRGLSIFASQPDDLWETFELDSEVPTWVTVAPEPDIGVLLRVLDESPRMAVVLLDGGDVRVYLAEQGRESREIKKHEQLPSRHAQGGWSQARYQRHVEFHRDMLLRDVADKLNDIFYAKGFDRVVLVGVEEVAKEFEALLPDPLRLRVIGHLTADFKQENDERILERARELAREDELSAEVALVAEIANFADAHGKGTLGLDDTFLTLVEGNVDILVVAEGVVTDGSFCHNCGYLSAHKFSQCPICASNDCEDYRRHR